MTAGVTVPDDTGAAHDASAIRLADVVQPLAIMYTGLTGLVRSLVPYANPDDPQQYPDSEDTIRLPGLLADDDGTGRDWLRAAIGHRALHDLHGTYAYRYGHAPALLPDSLTGVEPPVSPGAVEFEKFFSLFGHRQLAEHLFTVLEDVRVEARLPETLPGLVGPVAIARSRARARPFAPGTLPARAALAALLVEFSLMAAPGEDVPVPVHIAEAAAQLRYAVDVLRDPRATVSDTAETTIRVYCLITRLPALDTPSGPRTTPLPVLRRLDPPDPARWPDHGRVRIEGDAILDVPVRTVAYRDVLWPRFQPHTPAMPHHEAQIVRFIPGGFGTSPGAADHHHDGHHDHHHDHSGGPDQHADGGLHPLAHEHNEPVFDEPARPDGELAPDGPGTYVYHEWDGIRHRRRARWCRVRERVVPATTDAAAYHDVLHRHRDLLPQLRALIESLRPERYVTLGRQVDGDDVDLDAAVEALVDLRIAGSASDAVYLARIPAERDVAVAVLTDLSSSTGERLGGADDEERGFRDRPRVLDIEMDSAMLLAHAMEAVHDSFAVYGFSGRGRADTRFEVFKDFGESLTAATASRFSRAVPISGTRMGPAIRHASQKLRGESAQTRLLIVVSDGRPYDVDYGQEYGDGREMEYACEDVRAALEECRGYGLRPYLLTVDKDGLDYLRDVCGSGNYEVLDDVHTLPRRLLALYRELTDAGPALPPA